MYELVARILGESWLVLGQMAPYLLLGFLVAGLLSVGISPAWVERRLGKRGLGPVVTASLVGVPLPLCSCGVIPVSASIRRHGASRGATTALLLSSALLDSSLCMTEHSLSMVLRKGHDVIPAHRGSPPALCGGASLRVQGYAPSSFVRSFSRDGFFNPPRPK